MFRLIIAWLVALFLLPTALSAAERHMQVALVAETGTPSAGSTINIAIAMSPQPGWHGYWQNTGDAGMPDRIRWSLPEGVTITPLAYPVPERFTVAGLMNYVFAHPYALTGQISIPKNLPTGTPLKLVASIDYLVCSDTLCVPERADVSLDLTIGDGAIDPALQRRFDTWRAALPKPLGADSHFAVRDGKIVLGIPMSATESVKQAYFFPAQNGVIDYGAPQKIGIADNQLIVELAPKTPGRATPEQLTGVLRIERDQGTLGLTIAAKSGPVSEASRWLSTDESAALAWAPFILTLLAAIAGGFILNAMPCVFPILSLKALSLARTGESERAARVEALAYSAGVIVTCVALGGIILLLRAGGESVGWAFQLQNPHITLVLLLLMTAIGLNLAGLFELPSLSLDHPSSPAYKPSGAFLTGILAAFVATPCTGPFMGAALGSALILPPLAALAVFAGLGLGLALPFLAIAYIPRLRARMPKPGAWMENFRRILAIPMLLTAIGLGWVLWRQTGIGGLGTGAVGAVLTGLALWWLGLRQRRSLGGGLATLALVLAIVAPLAISTRLSTETTQTASASGDTAFNEATLGQLRQQGKPVFLYFTADWCLTCKVNEQAAINRDAVRAAFARNGIEVMIGDWTNGDPAISRFLESKGRSGVPLYLFYPKGGGEPQVLPQLLTAGMLTELGE